MRWFKQSYEESLSRTVEGHIFENDLGEKHVVIDRENGKDVGIQIPIMSMDDPRLWQDTLNWIEPDENGIEQLRIGTRKNPEDVARWEAWNQKLLDDQAQ